MIKQYAEGFVDVMIGDIVDIDGEVGPIYDIRFVQELRENCSYFECRLELGSWVLIEDIKIVQRKPTQGDFVEIRRTKVDEKANEN
jgi:hypothetical protein